MNLKISLLASAPLLALAVAPAQSAKLCVNPSSASCEATIQAAVDIAAAGDTITIASGFYNENVVVPLALDGLILKGGKKSILDGDDPLTGVAVTVDAPNVTLQGFTIQNGDDYGIEINADGALIVGMLVTGVDAHCVLIGGDGAILEKNTIVGCEGNAIDATGDDIEVVNNKISKGTNNLVDINGDGAIVEKNKFAQTDGNAVLINGDDAEVVGNKMDRIDDQCVQLVGDNALITGNQFVNSYRGIDLSGANPVVTKNRGQTMAYDPLDVDCTTTCSTAVVSGNSFNKVAEGPQLDANAPGMLAEKNSLKGPALYEPFEMSGTGAINAQMNQVLNVGSDYPCFAISGTGGHTLGKSRASDCYYDGIEVSGTGHTIHDNKVQNGLEDGIDLSAGTNVAINDNQIKNVLGVGLEIESSTGTTADGNSISGARIGICDEATGTVLTNNTSKKTHLPDQLNTAGGCPID